MKTISNNLPKQLLFLLTLLLTIAPACRKPLFQKPTLHKDSELIAGSVFTGLGAVGVPVMATTGAIGAIGLSALAGGGLTAAGLAAFVVMAVAPPLALLAIGIPLLVVGIKKKKKIKQQQMLEKLKQEQETRLQEESEEIQGYENQPENLQD